MYYVVFEFDDGENTGRHAVSVKTPGKMTANVLGNLTDQFSARFGAGVVTFFAELAS